MKSQVQNESLLAKLNEMQATCRLWMAVSNMKDERILELEAELNVLRQRVARLSRQVGRSQRPLVGARVRSAR